MARPKSTTTKQDPSSEQSLSSRIEKTRTKTNKASNYVLDLKVNSPASLGYLNIEGLDSAPAIVRLSKVKGLDVIAITDLYSGEFIDPLVSAAKESPLTVIPGVSLRCKVGSCDDVIISCLFPESTTSADISAFLHQLDVPAEAKSNSNFVVSHSLDQILHVLESFSGVAIPTRIDKTPHRLAVLGELVDTYGFRAFDLAYSDSAELFRKRWPRTPFRLFSFSDAYALAQIGSRTVRVKLNTPGFAGIKEIVARQAMSAQAAC
jgi:hypothetical protein